MCKWGRMAFSSLQTISVSTSVSCIVCTRKTTLVYLFVRLYLRMDWVGSAGSRFSSRHLCCIASLWRGLYHEEGPSSPTCTEEHGTSGATRLYSRPTRGSHVILHCSICSVWTRNGNEKKMYSKGAYWHREKEEPRPSLWCFWCWYRDIVRNRATRWISQNRSSTSSRFCTHVTPLSWKSHQQGSKGRLQFVTSRLVRWQPRVKAVPALLAVFKRFRWQHSQGRLFRRKRMQASFTSRLQIVRTSLSETIGWSGKSCARGPCTSIAWSRFHYSPPWYWSEWLNRKRVVDAIHHRCKMSAQGSLLLVFALGYRWRQHRDWNRLKWR